MKKRYLAVTRLVRPPWRVLYAGKPGEPMVDVVDEANKISLDVLMGVGLRVNSLEAAEAINNNLVIAAEVIVKRQFPEAYAHWLAHDEYRYLWDVGLEESEEESDD